MHQSMEGTENSYVTNFDPEIYAILQKLLKNGRTILGEHWVGLYLHGSLAYGDFKPQSSDIDFLILTKDHLSEDIFQTVKEMHRRLFISKLPWSQKLEGAYMPAAQLRRHDSNHPAVAWLGVDGHFARERLGSDWVLQRWILREKGVIIDGPPLRDMIDRVSPNDLREAVRSSLREWWSPPFPSPERFEGQEYRAYTVLTMCRSLYVLEHGRIASKPEAARWAIGQLPDWKKLIQEALDGPDGHSAGSLEGVFDFIGYTLQKAEINT